MKTLPIAPMEYLLRKAGADRVSESSKIELQKILYENIKKITPKAQEFALHASRKTIKADDVKMALDL